MKDDTKELQALCDAGGVVDLGGRTWIVHKILLAPRHNKLAIRNGGIYSPSDMFRPDKRYGIFEVAKGIEWQGVKYPDDPLNLSFSKVDFTGPLASWSDDFQTNQAKCKAQGAFCSAVNALHGRPDSLTFTECKFRNMFSGIGSFGTYRTRADRCQFQRIAAHSVVASVPHDNAREMVVDMFRCSARDVGTLFDVSAPDNSPWRIPPVVPKADVFGCVATDVLGRTKAHGMWDVMVNRCDFRQTRIIPTPYSGLNFPQARSVTVANTTISGYLAGGISCNDWVERPSLSIIETAISGGQIGINSTGRTDLQNVKIDCFLPWGDSSPPDTQNAVVYNPVALATIAGQYKAARAILVDWNRLHGTEYGDSYLWMTRQVKEAVLGMESE